MCSETTKADASATRKTTENSFLHGLSRAELVDEIHELRARVAFLEAAQGLGWGKWKFEEEEQ